MYLENRKQRYLARRAKERKRIFALGVVVGMIYGMISGVMMCVFLMPTDLPKVPAHLESDK
jgi:hypothetical protein